MNYRLERLSLRTKHPFGIARGTKQMFPSAILEIPFGNHAGMGEAAPSSYYGGENLDSVERFLARLDGLSLENDFKPSSVMEPFLRATEFDGAAKAALDMALWDLYGKINGKPAHECLGVPAPKPKETSFTIGLASPEEMERKTAEAARYPVLKVKAGTPQDEANLRLIRSLHKGKIRVDANAAWTPEEAVANIPKLAAFDVEFVEQPIDPRYGREGWKYVKERSPLPIVADESVRIPGDVAALDGVCDGVNIKLMKCGGLTEGLRMARDAKRRGMKVMLGCMIETSLAVTAAFHLSGLADWLDLDGHILIEGDPFEGVREVSPGVLSLPPGTGLSVARRG